MEMARRKSNSALTNLPPVSTSSDINPTALRVLDGQIVTRNAMRAMLAELDRQKSVIEANEVITLYAVSKIISIRVKGNVLFHEAVESMWKDVERASGKRWEDTLVDFTRRQILELALDFYQTVAIGKTAIQEQVYQGRMPPAIKAPPRGLLTFLKRVFS
jgi:hypothetical protein